MSATRCSAFSYSRVAPCMKAGHRYTDKVANKYCFRATAHLTSGTTDKHMATFTGYDKTPDVGNAVQKACQDLAKQKYDQDKNCWCTAAEMVLHEECPVECTGDVTVVMYDEYGV